VKIISFNVHKNLINAYMKNISRIAYLHDTFLEVLCWAYLQLHRLSAGQTLLVCWYYLHVVQELYAVSFRREHAVVPELLVAGVLERSGGMTRLLLRSVEVLRCGR
jgi:hypothetical protein